MPHNEPPILAAIEGVTQGLTFREILNRAAADDLSPREKLDQIKRKLGR